MSVVWPLFALCTSTLAAWDPIGPERGHVVDAAVGPDQVAVTTRIGVLTADVDLADWSRDSRFPPEVRRLAYGADGTAWAAPAGQIWRVGEQAQQVVFFESRTTPVDLAVTGSGALVAALRGDEAGLLRIEGDQLQRVHEGIDPWCLAAQGSTVVAGTVDGLLLRSDDDGRSFAPVPEIDGAVSAVALLDGELWVGLADGGMKVRRDDGWHELAALQHGFATGFALAPQGVLATVQRSRQGHDALVLYRGDWGQEIAPGRAGGDNTLVDLTGAWSLPDGRALVGSFRRGPMVYTDQGLALAQHRFRATVTGGVAVDDAGRIVLALMGTGVYVSDDAGATWRSPPSGSGPVTDSVAVVSLGDEVLVVDFEGVTAVDAQGSWRRLPPNPLLQPGQHLASVARGPDGALWAVDKVGRLYRLEGEAWSACRQRGLRLDGRGEHMLLATPGGYLAAAGCDEAWPVLPLDTSPQLDGRHARAVQGWVAGDGAVWRDGKKRYAIPRRSVSAVAARDDELLVALDDGSIQRCAERCEALGDPVLGGTVAALGWLPDGRLWAAELTGTLLVQGDGPTPSSWSEVVDARRVTGDLMPLERAPWDDESAPQASDRGPAQPRPPGPAQPPGPGSPPQDGAPHAASPAPPPEAAPSAVEAPGCGCGHAGGAGWSLAWLLPALSLRRRRR